MSDFNLATADKHEMKFYAANKLTPSLKLSLSMSEATMREKIQRHCADNGTDGPVAEIKAQGKIANNSHLVRINVSKSDKPGGDEPVFVGVQGVGYTIPRGVDIDVPSPVVEVLKNAMQDIITQDEDGEIHHNHVLAYPYNVIADPAPSAAAA